MDIDLQRSILAALDFEPAVDAAHIGVLAAEGVVTLTGRVASYPQKRVAETTTWRVRGVRSVAEEIEVWLPPHARRTDEEIALAVRDRLDRDIVIPGAAIAAKVEQGWVALSGEVEWRYQKDLAQDDVRRLNGVIGISNQIVIRPRASVGDVAGRVLLALQGCWDFVPGSVSVVADEGRVALTGAVRTPHERRLAAAMAWAAPGVTSVDNDIEIL